MSTSAPQIVAVTGSGAVGWHPLNPRTWSGSSHAFFSLLQKRGFLARAFGVEAPKLVRWRLLLKNAHPVRKRMRKQFYTDPGYRNALTREVRRNLRPEDFRGDIMQLGAMFNAAEAADFRAPCLTYMDSNVAISLRSPYAPKGMSAKRIDRILAYERSVYHSMTHIFTAGQYLRDSLVQDFDVAPEKITVLGMGINLPAIPEPPSGKAYDNQEVLFLGADFDRKGGQTLLRAFRTVRERLPHATLHIVGPERLHLSAEFSAGVEHHGHLEKNRSDDWRQLDSLFRRCSLFVMPSLYEPFGIAPLEAMAYETPCLASGIQALQEFVIPGRTGELVEPGDVDALADGLTGLLSDPASLQRMGIAARQMVLEHYTWTAVVEHFLEVVRYL